MNTVEKEEQVQRKVLVIDDDHNMLDSIREYLDAHQILVETADNGPEALEKLCQTDFDCIVTDINMPRMDGMEVMEKVFQQGYYVPIIILTGFGTVDNAVEAIRNGATDYLCKPFNGSELVAKINDAISIYRKSISIHKLHDWIEKNQVCSRLLGTSVKLQETLSKASKYFPTSKSMLIVGEKGTGKSDLAYLVHYKGGNKNIPINEIDPLAVSPAELKRILLTPRSQPVNNKHEIAESIIIKEIDDLPLRILNDPAWKTGYQKIGVRIFGLMTHSSFEKYKNVTQVKLVKFLQNNTIMMPSLRDRKEDIPILATNMLAKLRQNQDTPPALTPDAIHAMMLYEWPGNLIELESRLEGATVLALGPQISKHHLFNDEEILNQVIIPFREAKESFERNYLNTLLKKCKGNMSLASEMAKKDRKNLYQKIQKYKIDLKKFRS